jgi:hypothetical protein
MKKIIMLLSVLMAASAFAQINVEGNSRLKKLAPPVEVYECQAKSKGLSFHSVQMVGCTFGHPCNGFKAGCLYSDGTPQNNLVTQSQNILPPNGTSYKCSANKRKVFCSVVTP